VYVVSCRRNFTSDRIMGKENLVRNYTNPHDANVFQEMTLEELRAHATNKHVCVLVHGYRSPMNNVMSAYWDLVTRMHAEGVTGPQGYGLVVGFLWPGKTTRVGYFVARSSAKRAGPKLRHLVNDLRGVAHTVDIQTHSLGARVALTALRDSRQVFVDNLLMSAPAVDNNTLELTKEFHPALDSCNRCLVYHSRYDRVLRYTYPLGDVADGLKRALGLRGPRSRVRTLADTANLYVVDCAGRVKDHGGYRRAGQYYEHWSRVLSGDVISRYDELS
jgi:esterase/lipase superfamily enzyme